jgi:hypothetical protein
MSMDVQVVDDGLLLFPDSAALMYLKAIVCQVKATTCYP